VTIPAVAARCVRGAESRTDCFPWDDCRGMTAGPLRPTPPLCVRITVVLLPGAVDR
jgi:hypothetical protein